MAAPRGTRRPRPGAWVRPVTCSRMPRAGIQRRVSTTAGCDFADCMSGERTPCLWMTAPRVARPRHHVGMRTEGTGVDEVAETVRFLGGVTTWRLAARGAPGPADPTSDDAGVVVRPGRGRYVLPSASEHLRLGQSRGATLSHLSAALHHGWAVKTVPDARLGHRAPQPPPQAGRARRHRPALGRPAAPRRAARRHDPAAHGARLRPGAAVRRGPRRRRLRPAGEGRHPSRPGRRRRGPARHRFAPGAPGGAPTPTVGRPTRSSPCCGRWPSRRASSSLLSCRSPNPGCTPSSTSAARSCGWRSRPTGSSTTAPAKGLRKDCRRHTEFAVVRLVLAAVRLRGRHGRAGMGALGAALVADVRAGRVAERRLPRRSW